MCAKPLLFSLVIDGAINKAKGKMKKIYYGILQSVELVDLMYGEDMLI